MNRVRELDLEHSALIDELRKLVKMGRTDYENDTELYNLCSKVDDICGKLSQLGETGYKGGFKYVDQSRNENDYLNAEKMYATKFHDALKANDITSVKSIGQEIIRALPYTYRDIFDEVIRDTDSELAKKLQPMDYVAFMHGPEDVPKLYDSDGDVDKTDVSNIAKSITQNDLGREL